MDDEHRYLRTQGMWAIYDAIVANYLVAFALLLGASNTVVGLLGSIPFIAVLLSEFIGAKLTERWPRMRIILVTYALDKTMIVLIALLPFFTLTHPLYFVVALYSINKLLEGVRDPSLTSLLGTIVKPRTQGVFVARVYRTMGITGMITLLAAGWYISASGQVSEMTYALLFGAAALFGYATLYSFSTITVDAPPSKNHYALRDIIAQDGPFRKFCLRSSVFWFAAYLASPLIGAYMLRDLGMSPALYGVAVALQTLVQSATYRPWGRIADKYGDRPVAIIGILGTSLVTLLWYIITPATMWLVWPAQIIAGLAWAATTPALLNFLLDYSTPERRPIQNAQYAMFAATAQATGALAGGLLADAPAFLPVVGIPLVLLIATTLRVSSGMLFIGLEEPRQHHHQYRMGYVVKHVAHDTLAGPVSFMRHLYRKGLRR